MLSIRSTEWIEMILINTHAGKMALIEASSVAMHTQLLQLVPNIAWCKNNGIERCDFFIWTRKDVVVE